MRYRTKLYLSFLTIAALSSIFAVGVIQHEAKKALFAELRAKVIAVAATTAISIDGDLLAQIQTPEDLHSAAFQQIARQLRNARDANRKGDIYVKYLYTIRPDPHHPNQFVFIVDAEENPDYYSPIGSNDPGATIAHLYDHLNTPGYSFNQLISDAWGVWVTGYAPVYDSQGNYVGTVGADISAERVHHALNKLWTYSFIAFGISIALAALGAFFLARHATQALHTLVAAIQEIGQAHLSYRVHLTTKDEFEDVANSMNQMCEGLQEKERLKTGFARYVSQHVLEKILQMKDSVKLEGERRKVTVFFSDIRGFTHFAEQMPPEEVVTLLNEYFQTMLEIVFKHSGMLDKLIGDGIMAEFGVPIDDPEQEKNAVLTAIDMYKALFKLREKWKAEGKPQLDIGIGIHTGEAIVGSIGSEHKMEYTAIGDTVNVASRLEQFTKEGPYPIIISETTFQAIQGQFPNQALGAVTLPGRKQPIRAYAILIPD